MLSLCREAGFEPDICLRVSEIGTLISLVAAGHGVSLMPATVAGFAGAFAGAWLSGKLKVVGRSPDDGVYVNNAGRVTYFARRDFVNKYPQVSLFRQKRHYSSFLLKKWTSLISSTPK